MALKKLIPNRALRLTFKLLITALVLFVLDFAIWYVADVNKFKYENVVFTSVFLIIMLGGCYKIEKNQSLRNMSVQMIFLSLFVGCTLTSLAVAFIFSIPVLIFPNWLGLVGMLALMVLLGRSTRKPQTT
jgi:FtsH-binding integral membrane protein